VTAAPDRTRPEPRWLTIALILLTLALGTAGGAAFNLLRLPVAWMIGAMCTVMVATLLGAPMRMTQLFRQPMAAVLGVLVGSAFTPTMAARIPGWWPTLAAMAAYVLITSGILYVYFRRLLGLDPVTAFCAATPGGLNQMTILSIELGGDERVVGLSQGARILLVVLIIPFAFVALGLYDPATRPPLGASLVGYPLGELAVLAACGVVGFGGAALLRIPAASVTGPMVVSAAVHLFGWSGTGPPGELIAAAQVVIGASVGARFAGVGLRRIARIVVNAVGATVIMIGFTAAFAVTLYEVVDVPLSALILAFSPGGLAEMSLIALAMGIEVAFVATHHFIRITLIVIMGSALFRVRTRQAPPTPTGEAAPGE
jgi:membrane AbrB-like protein